MGDAALMLLVTGVLWFLSSMTGVDTMFKCDVTCKYLSLLSTETRPFTYHFLAYSNQWCICSTDFEADFQVLPLHGTVALLAKFFFLVNGPGFCSCFVQSPCWKVRVIVSADA
jgi:hypothetical protein